ncbi:MAG: KTSC domain-containing protein [Gammaproteobacteria bacterium]
MCAVTVESTTLATVAYDEAQELLQLEFCSRAVYLYFGVPAVVHQALLAAPSKGRYFNQSIRGRFSYRPILDSDGVPRDAQMPAKCHR